MDGPLDVADVREAVAYAVAAIEIVDSRIADWDITITDTVADNASSGLFVLGDTERAARRASSPVDVAMAHDRSTASEVSTGTGAACLGDPLKALSLAGPHRARLRRAAARRRGRALRRARPDGHRSRRATRHAPTITDARLRHRPLRRRRNRMMHKTKVADHRLRQHRHRPDDQGAAAVRDTSRWRAMVGIDPESDGLARAARLGVPTTARRRRRADRDARASTRSRSSSTPRRRRRTWPTRPRSRRTASGSIDLTPAAIGPFVVPAGQPRGAPRRAERQHGHLRRPGHDPDRRRGLAGRRRCPTPRSSPRSPRSRPARAPAPTSTSSPRPPRTRSRPSAAPRRGKAIIILNPAEPPLIMRDTVFCLDRRRRRTTAIARVGRGDGRARSRRYVPGYRLKQEVQFTPIADGRAGAHARCRPARPVDAPRSSVFLEVEGAAHYLPAYAGNLDIMTSAALRVAERHRRTRTPDGAPR